MCLRCGGAVRVGSYGMAKTMLRRVVLTIHSFSMLLEFVDGDNVDVPVDLDEGIGSYEKGERVGRGSGEGDDEF